MYQGWRNLLFYSWPVAPRELARLLPADLPVDTFEGTGWVSLVPFHMEDLHVRFLPPIPFTATFPEVNLRTYVRVRGEPGVYFFSIDAATCLGALVARVAFHLPFHQASMRFERRGEGFHMHSARRGGSQGAARLIASWTPRGKLRTPQAGSLEHFLLERYASFGPASGGGLWRGPLSHSDWEVQEADALVEVDDLITAAGLGAPSAAVAHFSPGVDTHVSMIQRVRGER